jgi:hypothetical protein
VVSKLKGARIGADEPCMFVRRSEPVLLTEEGLEGLCPSLNRPVVDAADMPVGPARAAIALYRNPASERRLAVAIRSEDSGAVTVFEFEGELSAAAHLALDSGLTFAEGMGFLFDEDMLIADAEDGRRQALECWCGLTGDELPPQKAEALVEAPPKPTPVEDGALMLHDLLDGIDEDLEADLGGDLEPDLEIDEPEPMPQSAVLSKFRVDRQSAPAAQQAAEPDPNGDTGPAELGRIPILRKRLPAEDAEPPLLARLLSRF